MAEKSVDLMAMFEGKMGFSAEDVPMDEEQVENFLLLCHQALLTAEGKMGDEGEEVKVKVMRVSDGNIHGAMDKLLDPYLMGGY
tara:strand:+ start:977 stop:1228 length:252 start_codon:yes stop_codon:yes gene_type:complete